MPILAMSIEVIFQPNFEVYDSAALVQKLKDQQVFVSLRADTIRFSPHFYNTKEDIGTTLDHIDQILITEK